MPRSTQTPGLLARARTSLTTYIVVVLASTASCAVGWLGFYGLLYPPVAWFDGSFSVGTWLRNLPYYAAIGAFFGCAFGLAMPFWWLYERFVARVRSDALRRLAGFVICATAGAALLSAVTATRAVAAWSRSESLDGGLGPQLAGSVIVGALLGLYMFRGVWLYDDEDAD